MCIRDRHSKVLPWMASPLHLSDFLTRSYNVGGLTSLLALSGLFDLMTQHNLEYPDFYQKLYEQLRPECLEVSYKTRFWQLINLCLVASPKLPAYLVAAFAKKLARLALGASPSGAMVALSVVFNMVYKHPSLRPLVQRDALGESEYDFNEPRADKCNALHDSLWELSALQEHYCPEVAAVAKAFHKDFESKTLKTFEPEEFVEQAYEVLIEDELDRRVKGDVPLAFEKASKLFGEGFSQVWSVQAPQE
eukprot:TRINITY_DN13437_c0_g1_i2.p1 TRINITY_DN13437_c0_g1~~TRINITY_DN13437_c0_g1_i2.p1  ORF type:complete len:249 (+),score=90.80 TRINITY_DN13437_c0_g1_i2:101-847(+)